MSARNIRQRAEAADAQIRALNGEPSNIVNGAAPVIEGEQPGDEPPTLVAEPVDLPEGTLQPAPLDPPAEPQPDDDDDEGTNEHRYKVLQGKYNAEKVRAKKALEDQADDFRAQMAQMRDMIALLQESRRAEPTRSAEPEPAPKPVVRTYAPLRPQEIDEVGQETLDVSLRYIMQELGPQIAAFASRLDAVEAGVSQARSTATATQQTVQMTARERMFALLDEKVSDWRAVNNDTAFKSWLAEEDEMSGQTRQALLVRAYERNEGQRVLAFFRKFKAEHASGEDVPAADTKPNGNTGQPPAAAPAPVDPRVHLNPGRGRAAPAGSTPQKITWTRADIAAFYRDVQAGKFKGNEGEADRLERDLLAAPAEGRFVLQ